MNKRWTMRLNYGMVIVGAKHQVLRRTRNELMESKGLVE
jgi:hypothetical protein